MRHDQKHPPNTMPGSIGWARVKCETPFWFSIWRPAQKTQPPFNAERPHPPTSLDCAALTQAGAQGAQDQPQPQGPHHLSPGQFRKKHAAHRRNPLASGLAKAPSLPLEPNGHNQVIQKPRPWPTALTGKGPSTNMTKLAKAKSKLWRCNRYASLKRLPIQWAFFFTVGKEHWAPQGSDTCAGASLLQVCRHRTNLNIRLGGFTDSAHLALYMLGETFRSQRTGPLRYPVDVSEETPA